MKDDLAEEVRAVCRRIGEECDHDFEKRGLRVARIRGENHGPVVDRRTVRSRPGDSASR